MKMTNFLLPVVRGVGLFLGVFTLLNIVGSWRTPGFSANGWWIDVGFVPKGVGHWGLMVAAVGLVLFGMGWLRVAWMRRATAVVVGGMAGVALWNAAWFYFLWGVGRIHPGVAVPLSLVLSVVLSAVVRGIVRGNDECRMTKDESNPNGPLRKCSNVRRRLVVVGVFLASFVVFPVAQMYCFGKTDYRRKADAAVVFGAKANADGTASQALEDRTRTGIALYKAGLVRVLVFSGGPGAGAVSEPEVMRRMALAEGVPASAIITDEAGLNTDATVTNTAAIFEARGIKTVLAVSHWYHLPRVKMAYARGLEGRSVEVYTVPAVEGQVLTALPYFMAREVVALWVYYLRPLVGG